MNKWVNKRQGNEWMNEWMKQWEEEWLQNQATLCTNFPHIEKQLTAIINAIPIINKSFTNSLLMVLYYLTRAMTIQN